ncbi:MAG: hypothetical protein R2822_10245 [Spirosomataceae bacterium]
MLSCSIKQIEEKAPPTIDFAQLPYKTLSEYGFFEGKMNDLQPTPRVLLYEPASSLFTDYAFKKRFVSDARRSFCLLLT